MKKPNKLFTLSILIVFLLSMTGTALATPGNGNGKGNGNTNKGKAAIASTVETASEDQETDTDSTVEEDTETPETDGDEPDGGEPAKTKKGKTNEFRHRVRVKGTNVNFDVPPVIKDGRVLIPVRGIMNSLGAEVAWDSEAQTVTVTKGDQVVVLTLGSDTILVDGVETTIDVPAQTECNRTVVPIRFLAEVFGKIVSYDDETGDIDIEDPAEPGTDPTGDEGTDPDGEGTDPTGDEGTDTTGDEGTDTTGDDTEPPADATTP